VLAGSGANDYANGVGLSASFNHASGIGVDDALAKLYVSDAWNSRIRLVDIASAAVTDLVGGNYAYINGRGGVVGFMNPVGIAVDSASNIYVGDNQNTAIRFIARAGV
jgi:sugar lactone lactonase YvrE